MVAEPIDVESSFTLTVLSANQPDPLTVTVVPQAAAEGSTVPEGPTGG